MKQIDLCGRQLQHLNYLKWNILFLTARFHSIYLFTQSAIDVFVMMNLFLIMLWSILWQTANRNLSTNFNCFQSIFYTYIKTLSSFERLHSANYSMIKGDYKRTLNTKVGRKIQTPGAH